MGKAQQGGRSFLEKLKAQPCFLCAGPKDLIYETEDFMVLLDRYPSVAGHTLVAPKKHFKRVADVDVADYEKLQALVYKTARALEKIYKPYRLTIHSTSLSVEHLHFHVVPVPNEEMLWDFKYLKKDTIIKYKASKRRELQDKIARAIINA